MWKVTEDRIRAMLNHTPHFSEVDDQFDHGIVVLSYEGIEVVYADLASEFSKFAIALDLTENEITDLSFLKTFHKLQSLVLDKNRHLDPGTMPTMKNLQIFWLNSCNIPDITKWIDVIRVRCPKLRCLSLINNPGAKSLINLSTCNENEQYRSYVASKLKNLEILDEAPVIRSARMTSVQFLSKLFHFNTSPENCNKTDLNETLAIGDLSTTQGNKERPAEQKDEMDMSWWSNFSNY